MGENGRVMALDRLDEWESIEEMRAACALDEGEARRLWELREVSTALYGALDVLNTAVMYGDIGDMRAAAGRAVVMLSPVSGTLDAAGLDIDAFVFRAR